MYITLKLWIVKEKLINPKLYNHVFTVQLTNMMCELSHRDFNDFVGMIWGDFFFVYKGQTRLHGKL